MPKIARGSELFSWFPRIELALDPHAQAIAKLNAREYKLMLSSTFQIAIDRWIVEWLPRRFTPYARAKLGYDLHSGHIKRKKEFGAPQPLVWTGRTRESVLSRAEGVISGSVAKLRARVKMGPTWPGIVTEVLETVPDNEWSIIEGYWLREIEPILQQILTTTTKRGKIKKATLTGAQSQLGTPGAAAGQQRQGRKTLAKNDAVDFHADAPQRAEAGSARRARRLKSTHDRWRRTSGGSAGDGSQVAKSYHGSAKARAAARQRAYRQRIKQ